MYVCTQIEWLFQPLAKNQTFSSFNAAKLLVLGINFIDLLSHSVLKFMPLLLFLIEFVGNGVSGEVFSLIDTSMIRHTFDSYSFIKQRTKLAG